MTTDLFVFYYCNYFLQEQTIAFWPSSALKAMKLNWNVLDQDGKIWTGAGIVTRTSSWYVVLLLTELPWSTSSQMRLFSIRCIVPKTFEINHLLSMFYFKLVLSHRWDSCWQFVDCGLCSYVQNFHKTYFNRNLMSCVCWTAFVEDAKNFIPGHANINKYIFTLRHWNLIWESIF